MGGMERREVRRDGDRAAVIGDRSCFEIIRMRRNRRKGKHMHNPKKQKSGAVYTFLWALPIGIGVPILITPVILILVFAGRLGPWPIPLLVGYFALLYAAIYYFNYKKMIISVHGASGNERFYDLYPNKLKKVLQAKRKDPLPEETAKTLELYKAKLEGKAAAADETGERKARTRSALFYAAAALAALCAGIYVYVMIRSAENGADMDFPFCLRIVTTAMLFIAAGSLAFKKPQKVLNDVTAILLFLNIWSDLTGSYLSSGMVTLEPMLESLIVFVLFLIAAFGLAAAARRIRTPKEIILSRGEFDLAMYELGEINEMELARRFG